MTARAVWTYADYAAMPDDGRRYEALALRADRYEPVGRLRPGERGALPPLEGLVLDPGRLLTV